MKTTKFMNQKKFCLTGLLFTAALFFCNETKAQSTDIDSPTMLSGNTIEGLSITDEKIALYYNICVKPGTLKVTADLTSEYGGSMVYFHFLNENFKEIAENDFRGEEHKNRSIKEFKFAKAQKLILKLTFINLTTDGKVTFDGAINTSGNCSSHTTENRTTDNSTTTTNSNSSTKPTTNTNSTTSDTGVTTRTQIAGKIKRLHNSAKKVGNKKIQDVLTGILN